MLTKCKKKKKCFFLNSKANELQYKMRIKSQWPPLYCQKILNCNNLFLNSSTLQEL